MPAGLSADARLAQAEAVLTAAEGLSATFEIESAGEHPAKLSGHLELAGPNRVKLTAEGTFATDTLQLELDSLRGDVNTSATKGANVSNHHAPPAPALTHALVVGLSRMGLLHNLARLAQEETVDHAEGGADGWVRALEAKDGGPDTSSGQPCRRVDFAIEVSGRRMGEASVCISDETSLPLQRRQTVHFEQGDMTVTETFHWKTQ